MPADIDLALTAETLRRASKALRRCNELLRSILGETPEEVKLTLKAMEGLSPEEIRRALEHYRRMREG